MFRAAGTTLPVAFVFFGPVSHRSLPLSRRTNGPGLTTRVRVTAAPIGFQ